MNPTQSGNQNVFQKLVRRMTRFFVSTDFDQTIKRLSQILDHLGYTWKINDCGMVSGNASLSSKCGKFINSPTEFSDNNIDGGSTQAVVGVQNDFSGNEWQHIARFPIVEGMWIRIQKTIH